MLKYYEVGQKFISNKNTYFYNTEEELIDVWKGDVFCINDIMDYPDDETPYYYILFGDSDIEVHVTQQEIDELIA